MFIMCQVYSEMNNKNKHKQQSPPKEMSLYRKLVIHWKNQTETFWAFAKN